MICPHYKSEKKCTNKCFLLYMRCMVFFFKMLWFVCVLMKQSAGNVHILLSACLLLWKKSNLCVVQSSFLWFTLWNNYVIWNRMCVMTHLKWNMFQMYLLKESFIIQVELRWIKLMLSILKYMFRVSDHSCLNKSYKR